MNEYDSPKEFLDEHLWFGGIAIAVVVLLSISIYVFVSSDKARTQECIEFDKMNGPTSFEHYHAPRGMNGPSENQVIGRGR